MQALNKGLPKGVGVIPPTTTANTSKVRPFPDRKQCTKFVLLWATVTSAHWLLRASNRWQTWLGEASPYFPFFLPLKSSKTDNLICNVYLVQTQKVHVQSTLAQSISTGDRYSISTKRPLDIASNAVCRVAVSNELKMLLTGHSLHKSTKE